MRASVRGSGATVSVYACVCSLNNQAQAERKKLVALIHEDQEARTSSQGGSACP